MSTDRNKANRKWAGWALAGILALSCLGFAARAVDVVRLAFATDAAPRMTFQSRTEAATALAQAAKDTDEKALTKVLGAKQKPSSPQETANPTKPLCSNSSPNTSR